MTRNQQKAMFAKLNNVQRLRGIKFLTNANRINNKIINESKLVNLSKNDKQALREVRKNININNKFIRKLKSEKTLTNKELKDLSSMVENQKDGFLFSILDKNPLRVFNPVVTSKVIVGSIRPRKIQKDVRKVLIKRGG